MSAKNTPSKELSKVDFALFMAIDANDPQALRLAIGNKANINCQSEKLTSPLIAAINAGKPQMIEQLLALGADPNMPDAVTGLPPLAFAFHDGCDPQVATLLINQGADPFWSSPESGSDFNLERLARESKRPDLLKLIDDARAQRTRDTVNSARQAGAENALPHRIAPVAILSEDDLQSLSKSMGSGRVNDMAAALGKAAEASISDAISPEQWTQLTASARLGLSKSNYGPAELAKALVKLDARWSYSIKFNADDPAAPEAEREDVGSFFDRASAHGKLAEIEFWSAACGPDWNPDGGSNPLMWTVYGAHSEAAALLLSLGADPNLAPDPVGPGAEQDMQVDSSPPLAVALANGQIDIALALLAKGARATDVHAETMSRALASVDDQARRGVVASLGEVMKEADLDAATRAVAGLASLCSRGWTRDEDFASLIPAADAAAAKFGSDFRAACQTAMKPVSMAQLEFQAVLAPRGASQEYGGSLLDRAAATGQLATLDFFSACAGPDWNPDGGDRPIDWAASVGDAKAIEILAKRGSLFEDGRSVAPLPNAIAGGWADATRVLVLNGADPGALPATDVASAYELLTDVDLNAIAKSAMHSLRLPEPADSFFGLNQLWNLAKVGWVPDWAEASSALDQIGFAPHIERAKAGMTQAGHSLARQDGHLLADLDGEAPLPGKANHFARLAREGDLDACRFLARALGPDFRAAGDNGTPLANAVAGGKIDTARMLISLGANMEAAGAAPLDLAARNSDSAMFLMLASQGAKSDSLSGDARALAMGLLANKASQQALVAIIPGLLPEEDGFDQFLGKGAMPSAIMASLIRAGQKERFWRNRERIDWTRDVGALVEAAMADGEAGLGAYAKFRRALAADDIDAARGAIESTPALLASLSKRQLADEAILASLGAGRSALMKSMADHGWPMEATMREHAAEALAQAAASKDASMFEVLLPMAPADGALPIKEQESIARAAWKLGGAAMLSKLDSQIGGIAPAAIEACRDIFTGMEGEKAFSQIAVAGIEREVTRSRALDKKEERDLRRQAAFGLAVNHWSGLSDEQKMRCACGVAKWNQPQLWAKAEERIGQASANPTASTPPAMAFYDYCFSSRDIARAVFSAAGEDSMKSLARAAQMSAAAKDDSDLASISTIDAGVPTTEEALLRAARLGHTQTLKCLLGRVEGQTLKGLLSRALIPQGAARANFLDPELPSHELPASACRELVEAGASFDPRDLEGEGAALLAELAKRAKADALSADREKCFSLLALRGAIPPAAWMDKASILAREPMFLEFASDADRSDPSTLEAAVSVDGMALRFASPLGKATLSVAKAACAQNPEAVHCVHKELVKAWSLTEGNCQAVLGKALDDSKSINPLKMLSKKAARNIEESAQTAAREEMAAEAKMRSLDFVPLERGIADAKLREQDRQLAEMVLARAKAIRTAFKESGTVSNLEMNDLRRIVEKNLPDTFARYIAVDPAGRDEYDGDTRTTANKMLKASLTDAMTVMEGISVNANIGAKRGLAGEAAVLQSKAASTGILRERGAAEASEAQKEDQALDTFGGTVDSAIGAVAGAGAVKPKGPGM